MDCLRTQFTKGVLLNDRYETVSPLNHGSFGMVIMGKHRLTGDLVAIKCLTNPSAAAKCDVAFKVDDRSEELKIHSRIGYHPNVVNFLDSFASETHTYLVLEYCSRGDLYEAIRMDKGPKETEHVREFMLQLVTGVESLHDKGVYHRDIKPENIFLTDNGNVKLGDFGLASMDTWSYESAVGSDRYMAPEQYDPAGNGLSPRLADIWSVGICLLNILFSRNPFGVPATSDPLFADYVRDRQSLFDVFPNLSQDTFDVLIHCLAIDPAKRDLALVKEALERAVSFTTDDESLDEFCTEDREVITATANRQPLRTPSVSSPAVGKDNSFPWGTALHMTSPQRQPPISLDTVYDEDMFTGSEASQDWVDKLDAQSFHSTIDSGLGVSLGSSHFTPESNGVRSKPVPIAGSLPSLGGRATSALASIFGKKKQFESKSWSDLYDEDEEEELERERTIQAYPTMPSRPSVLSMLSQEDTDDDGRSTPRALSEIKNSSTLNAKTANPDNSDHISEHTGFVFEEHALPPNSPPKYSPPTTKKIIADKWAQLGEMRRKGINDTAPPKDVSPPSEPNKSRFRPANWKRNFGRYRQQANRNEHAVWERKEWNISKDWRRSDQSLPRSPLSMEPSQVDGSPDRGDDGDDFMWVGGWKELHL